MPFTTPVAVLKFALLDMRGRKRINATLKTPSMPASAERYISHYLIAWCGEWFEISRARSVKYVARRDNDGILPMMASCFIYYECGVRQNGATRSTMLMPRHWYRRYAASIKRAILSQDVRWERGAFSYLPLRHIIEAEIWYHRW